MVGMIVCAELSRSTSAMPSSNVETSTRVQPGLRADHVSTSSGPGSDACRPSTAKATISVSPARIASIDDHRLAAIDPIGDHAGGQREHEPGQRWATSTRAISNGLRVTADASHG